MMKKWKKKKNCLEVNVCISSLPFPFSSFLSEDFTQKAFKQAIGKEVASGAADWEVLGISHIQGN